MTKKISKAEVRRRMHQSSKDKTQAGWSDWQVLTATGSAERAERVILAIDVRLTEATQAMSKSTKFKPTLVWEIKDGYCRVAAAGDPAVIKWRVDGETREIIVPANGMSTLRRRSPVLTDTESVSDFGWLEPTKGLYEVGGKFRWQIRSS